MRRTSSASVRRNGAAKRGVAGAAAIALALGLSASPANAAETELPGLVKIGKVRKHLENLNTIAEYNGGNRAHGTAGYDVAAKYVVDQLKRAGYKPERNEYEFESWVERTTPEFAQTKPEARDFANGEDFLTMRYSTSGDVTAPGVPVNADSNASGCAAADYAGFPKGAVAVVKRGTCLFAEKEKFAAEAGASALVVFNHGATSDPADTGPVNGDLSATSTIPVVGATPEVGKALVDAGEALELRVKVDSEVVSDTGYNIVAETSTGKKDNVVVVGAHLDSVEEGPGINDNGSGTAAVLETAKQLPKLGKQKNRVRFAFWGTEELGLIGSTEYVENLTQAQRDKIALYLNFDMIGSNNYARQIYDGRGELDGSVPPPSGSAAIQKLFEEYYDGRGLPHEPTEFSGRSDYSGFMNAGIPSGGLFSGADAIKTEEQVAKYGGTAGKPLDPYYHSAEDTLENINWTIADDMTDAMANSVETYADSTLPVNGVLRTKEARTVEFDRRADHWLR
ncbi:aminopeptidase Y [Murinocardiopsis flavida]|uniref:Aminopeptidase Y n=1 Tax=Murinocardiopsis flavida TaxID=645275 RepID=A0A2P8CMS2_9ACTN|nr:aminopeptidase Y [Murinocardiopsis flavida]